MTPKLVTPGMPAIPLPKLGQSRADIPFNITLLDLNNPDILRNVKRVSVLDSSEGATTDFHRDGLFSTEIFGRVGDERRSMLFGYIDIKAQIFHPVIYNCIVKLKRFYADILAGKKFAIWDDNIKDYVPAKQADGGRTGFAFFLEHWDSIHFEGTDSIQRGHMIQLVKMAGMRALTNKIVVMPAGYRDMEIDENGRRSEHEINDLYRRLIRLSNVIIESSLKTNPDSIDKLRFEMQRVFCEIYDMIEDMVKGKKKLFLGKFAARRIAHGTRNVITAMNTAVSELGAPGNADTNSTIIGLYQYLQANLLASVFHVTQFLAPIFPDVNVPAKLVDPKTLKPKEIYLSAKLYDRWATKEGIEKVIGSFREESIRKNPILVEGNYLGLIYEGPDNTFRFFQDIDELPKDRDRADVRPATLMDILYLSVYRFANKYPIYVTRYPITGVGSVYPSWVHLRTTVKWSKRECLNDWWEPKGESFIAYEYPNIKSAFLNSLVPHSKNLARLGADFDGDTSSGNIAFTDDVIEEVREFLKSKRAYVGSDGKLLYGTGVDTVKIVMWNMTGDPVPRVQRIQPATESYQAPEIKYDTERMISEWRTARPQLIATSRFSHLYDELHQLNPEDVDNGGDTNRPIYCIEKDGKLKVVDGILSLAKNVEQLFERVPVYILTEEQYEEYAMKPGYLRPAIENYREGADSTVTSNGKEYSVDKLLDLVKDVKPTKTPIEYLEWMRKSVSNLDPKRVEAADTSIPLIAAMYGQRVVVLDGSHRMAKLFEAGATTAEIRFVPFNKLELALVD